MRMSEVDPLMIYGALAAFVLPFVWLVRGRCEEAGRPAAYAFVVFCFALVLAQGWADSRATFPFVTWTMYGSAGVPTTPWHVAFERAGGVEDALGPIVPVPGPNTRGLYARAYARASGLEAAVDPAARERAERDLAEFFGAIERIGALRRVEPAGGVILHRCRIDWEPGAGRDAVVCDGAPHFRLQLPHEARD
jgi:hypothetical protein